MNDTKFLPDDPKLTAYALGELEGDEHAAVEAALHHDPAARTAVEEIRAMGTQLEAALAGEGVAGVAPAAADPQLRTAIIAGRDRYKLDGGPLKKVIQFPQFYYVAAGLAAACFALLVSLRQPKPPLAQKTYVEVDLSQLPAATVMELPVATKTEADTVVSVTVAPSVPAAPVATANTPAASANTIVFENKIFLPGEAKKADALRRDLLESSARLQPPVPPAFGGSGLTTGGTLTISSLNSSPAAATGGALTLSGGAAPKEAGKDSYAFADAPVTLVGGAGGKALAEGVAMDRPSSPLAMNYARAATGSVVLAAAKQGQALEPVEARTRFYAPVAPGITSNTESYAYVRDNDFLGAAQNPLSTFSIDVDTASYAIVRRELQARRLPPRDAVRVEELVNYFPYRYAPPAVKRGENVGPAAEGVPFAASMEVAEAPWAPTHRLVRVGLKGREVSTAARPAANLVFLLDVSGSMNAPNRLPLVKESMRLLVGQLRADDRVAIVTYAGQSGLALPSTPVAQASEILAALDALTPGGSTNGAMGIQLAYDIAKANFITGGLNRVILCTDGDFNVGVTSEGGLVRLIEEKAKSGVFLTALGYGMGNLKDRTLEQLADKGNGNYGYIDTRREAEKLLVAQVNGTLMTIAKDVKIQVEFNPALVASYRLIGYENRLLKKEDFNNDQIDAREIGAGHTVTALYEIVPVGADEKPAASAVPAVDELKYAPVGNPKSKIENQKSSGELLTLKLRYKEPAGDVSSKLEFPLTDAGGRFANASGDFKFAAAVAVFGMILRDSPHKGSATMGEVIAWAAAGAAGSSDDPSGYRGEFIDLARQAQMLLR